jgi:microcystin-dependent protein
MAYIAGVQYSGVPAGTILPCGTNGALPRTLLCNGASYLVADYPALFAAIGYSYGGAGLNFNVPDTRNVFLRGVNASTRAIGGVTYPAVTRGATVTDTMQGHRHNRNTNNAPEFVVQTTAGTIGFTGGVGAQITPTTTGNSVTDGTNGAPRTGVETAPVNLGVNYCISF